MTGRLDAHTVEKTIEVRQRNIVKCTQEDLLKFLELNPNSSLALLYKDDFEFPDNTPEKITKIADRVTRLLADNTIPHPSQTLEELCAYLDESIMKNI